MDLWYQCFNVCELNYPKKRKKLVDLSALTAIASGLLRHLFQNLFHMYFMLMPKIGYLMICMTFFFGIYQARGLKITCILCYCSEGDNISDAFGLAEAACKFLGLITSNFKGIYTHKSGSNIKSFFCD